jgi:hypothetical protein
MGKESLLNDGVFTKIVGTREKKSAYEQFVDYGKNFSPTDADLLEFTGKYEQLVKSNKDDLELLSCLEELIMQLRALDKLEQNVKYSIGGRNSEYIYAYALFYRHNHTKKDIREIVGKTEIHGSDPAMFLGNSELKTRAVVYLSIKMGEVIHRNREYVNNLLENKFGSITNII